MVVVTQLNGLRGATQVTPPGVLPDPASTVNTALQASGGWTQIQRLNGLRGAGLGNMGEWWDQYRGLVLWGSIGLIAGAVAGRVIMTRKKR